MIIDELANKIISKIDNNWTNLEKIRFVYLELGKYLSKDTDFFFSADNKLDELNFNFNQIKDIYNSLEGRKKGSQYEVICRSAGYILHKIYEKIGIKSKLINTINDKETIKLNDQEIDIYHWLLVVYDKDKPYFMLLNADLPYIKENMKVHHFASKIPYKKLNKDGILEQLYEGEEIIPTLLSEEETRKIDEKIGYLKYYYKYDNNKRKQNNWQLQYNDTALLMLKNNLKNNAWYYQILAQNTSFYKSLYNFVGKNNKNISFDNTYINELSDDDKKEWITLLCFRVNQLLKIICGVSINTRELITNFDYNIWIKNICNQIYKMSDFNYTKWSKEVKNDQKINHFDYNNPIVILDKTNALVNCINNNMNSNFNELLNRLAFHFIDERYIINEEQKKSFINNYYLSYKFATLFPKIFSANEITTDFNEREYSEQIVIIKEIIEIMFPELNKKNSNIENYNDKYSPVQNRIHIYTIKDKNTLDYSIVFNIVGNNNSGDYYFLYNPKTNKFSNANILDIYQNYIIVSDRFKSKLEDFDYLNNKKRK